MRNSGRCCDRHLSKDRIASSNQSFDQKKCVYAVDRKILFDMCTVTTVESAKSHFAKRWSNRDEHWWFTATSIVKHFEGACGAGAGLPVPYYRLQKIKGAGLWPIFRKVAGHLCEIFKFRKILCRNSVSMQKIRIHFIRTTLKNVLVITFLSKSRSIVAKKNL